MLLSNTDHGHPSILSTYPTRRIIVDAPLGIGHLVGTGVKNRAERIDENKRNITRTLEQLKAAAEADSGAP